MKRFMAVFLVILALGMFTACSSTSEKVFNPNTVLWGSAGAVVGSVVAGPGVGTAAGAAVGTMAGTVDTVAYCKEHPELKGPPCSENGFEK